MRVPDWVYADELAKDLTGREAMLNNADLKPGDSIDNALMNKFDKSSGTGKASLGETQLHIVLALRQYQFKYMDNHSRITRAKVSDQMKLTPIVGNRSSGRSQLVGSMVISVDWLWPGCYFHRACW